MSNTQIAKSHQVQHLILIDKSSNQTNFASQSQLINSKFKQNPNVTFANQCYHDISTETSRNSTHIIKPIQMQDMSPKMGVVMRRHGQHQKIQEQQYIEEEQDSGGRLFTFMNSTKDLQKERQAMEECQNLKSKIEVSRLKREKILSQIILENKIIKTETQIECGHHRSPLSLLSIGSPKYNKVPQNCRNSHRKLQNKSLTPKVLPRKLKVARNSLNNVISPKSTKQIRMMNKPKSEKNVNNQQKLTPRNSQLGNPHKNRKSNRSILSNKMPFFKKVSQNSHTQENYENITHRQITTKQEEELIKKKEALEKQLMSINQSLLLKKKKPKKENTKLKTSGLMKKTKEHSHKKLKKNKS